MGFFERLFCSHDYICVRNFVAGDGYLSSVWRCKHCGKETSKRGQHEVHASVQTTGRKSHNNVATRRNDENRNNDDFMNPLNPISQNYTGNYSTSIGKPEPSSCQPSHDYGSSSYSSSNSCSSSSYSSSSSSSGD